VVGIISSEAEGRDTLDVTFETCALFDFPDVPHLQQAVIPTGNNFGLECVELHHPNAGLVVANGCGFVGAAVEPFRELCDFDLSNGASTVRSLEQVTIDFSLGDQFKENIDLEWSFGIWHNGVISWGTLDSISYLMS
jgi:hypothetical protein